MQPVSAMPMPVRRGIDLLFCDIDDTVTTEGRLTAAAYAALERLAQSGIRVVPVTGRPAGWCDMIARFWPVAGVVGENGAFYFAYDPTTRRMTRRFAADAATRAANRSRLQALGAQIVAQVPGCAISADQLYREADLAIDFREDVAPLPEPAIDRIVALFEAAGAVAKVSSIHVNGWFGDYDKLTMAAIFAREMLGAELAALRDRAVFVGDSPNDAPMFGYFPHAIGVANVHRLAARIASLPAYVTEAEAGSGFAEAVAVLLDR